MRNCVQMSSSSKEISIFTKFNMAAVRRLEFVWEVVRPPTRPVHGGDPV